MGLDIVEFVMNVEETFDIRIPDRDAERIRTPRMLIDYIAARVPPSPVGRWGCGTQRAFYAIRRALGKRHDLRPCDTLPREAWAYIGTALKYRRWERFDSTVMGVWFGLPSEPANAGAGARELAARAPHTFRDPGEGWAGGDVEMTVRRLVREHLPVNEFDLDDSFVDMC
ncbi:MAG TPA: acyl carrier protein [Gemmataceae bacterium]|nr:acyl carrier protein [Gemmataceae bacterium]